MDNTYRSDSAHTGSRAVRWILWALIGAVGFVALCLMFPGERRPNAQLCGLASASADGERYRATLLCDPDAARRLRNALE